MNDATAKRLLLGGIAAILVSMLANLLLGGSGGLVWMVLIVAGAICAMVAIAHYVMHPVRRGS